MKIKCICCGNDFKITWPNKQSFSYYGERCNGKTLSKIKEIYDIMCCSDRCKDKIFKALYKELEEDL